MALTIEFHALQTLPPSNINRDDTGAPKSAMFGGVTRQRVSSQAWKRAIRKDFEDYLDTEKLGKLSKRTPARIAKRIREIDESIAAEQAEAAVEALFKPTKIEVERVKPKEGDMDAVTELQTKFLLFLSNSQIERAAQFLVTRIDEKFKKAEVKDLLDKDHSVDIALFGRMIANANDFNVDAAVQVAHAIGVHESEPDFDFYTAVDDLKADHEDAGAGMLGTMQMMSSTLYRFAAVDFETLTTNLGSSEAAIEALTAFGKSFVRALPTGKLNSYANWTLPELVYVTVRPDRPVSLVNAFIDPVTATSNQERQMSAAVALADEARAIQDTYGMLPDHAWIAALGNLAEPFTGIASKATLSQLLDGLTTAINEAR